MQESDQYISSIYPKGLGVASDAWSSTMRQPGGEDYGGGKGFVGEMRDDARRRILAGQSRQYSRHSSLQDYNKFSRV